MCGVLRMRVLSDIQTNLIHSYGRPAGVGEVACYRELRSSRIAGGSAKGNCPVLQLSASRSVSDLHPQSRITYSWRCAAGTDYYSCRVDIKRCVRVEEVPCAVNHIVQAIDASDYRTQSDVEMGHLHIEKLEKCLRKALSSLWGLALRYLPRFGIRDKPFNRCAALAGK